MMKLASNRWFYHIFVGIIIQLAVVRVNGGPTELYVGSTSPPEGTGNGITIFQEVQQFTEYIPTGSMYSQSPSFMVMNSAEDLIYAVNELADYDGESGTLSAFQINPDGNLTLASIVALIGSRPCHLTLDPSGKFVLVASYASGNVEVYRLEDGGTIGIRTDNVYAPTDDPSIAMAHMVIFEPTEQHVAVSFKGLDAVYFYNLDENGHLTPYDYVIDGTTSHVRAELTPGSGPRHLVYSQDGAYFYVISELASTITVFDAQVDQTSGIFPELQTVSTHPENYNGSNWASEIAIHPNGAFLYSSDRADNVIGTYSIDTTSGFLTPLAFQATTGQTPRFFTIDPSGKALYSGNADSDTIDVFEINEDATLALRYTIENIPSPVFILYKQLADVLD